MFVDAAPCARSAACAQTAPHALSRARARVRAVTLAFFTLPKLYEKNQAQCDQLLAAAEAQLKVVFEKLPELPKAQRVSKKVE